MTEKLFRKDPYMKEFKATVTGIDNNRVTLDRTAFFPFSGGQAGDTGEVGRCRVTNTVYEGDEIVHILENCLINKMDKVHCELDWERRYTIMKLHSAAHIVYNFFVRKWGEQKLIGSNISESKARLDFEMDRNIADSLPEIEGDVNRFIAEGHVITTREEPGGLRLWECETIKMPCGGTHVKSTSEINGISLKRKNIGSGKERIEVTLC